MLGLFGAIAFIRRLIGRPFRDWSVWAAQHPEPAAIQLRTIAVVLAARAEAIAERRGETAWRVRRDRALALNLRRQADEIVNPETRDKACQCVPGN